MNIGVLGTGIVERTLSAKLAQLGHSVTIGTRDPARTLARTEPDFLGNPPFSVWHQQNHHIRLVTFAEAASFGEILLNCTAGAASLEALRLAGENNLNDKVLIDVANPLDFSKGMPPTLTVCNSDSLGEQIQRAFPQVKVVKTLNTITASLMINPALVPGGHDIFVSGNDAAAKAQVADLLRYEFGWQSVIDLGDISTARGVEMLLPVWLNLLSVLQTPLFNFKIAR